MDKDTLEIHRMGYLKDLKGNLARFEAGYSELGLSLDPSIQGAFDELKAFLNKQDYSLVP
jgi:hypothetical protein